MTTAKGKESQPFSLICTCVFIRAGESMDQSSCAVHTQQAYVCDDCECRDYRPKRQPSDQNHGGWPACVCGHAATNHN